MGIPGGWELVLIVGVVLLLFGGKKIPELAKGLGKGIKDFKQAVNEDDEPVAEKTKEIEAKAEQAAEEVKETVTEVTKA
jgi:sec-independent protein translocase protein TatA